MRTLTEAEGRVIAVLLGSTPASERERLARMQVPRSTYHAARKRAYEEGWLRDRYIPDPARFGAPFATVAVVRPFADRIGDLSKRLASDRANVVAWVGAQSALCVYFHGDRKSAEKAVAGLTASGVANSVTAVIARIDQSEVPVYFDYEGLWSHLSGLSGAATYPNGLGGRSLAPASDDPPLATPHQVWAARELVNRPFDAQSRGRGGHLIGPFGLPFSEQKLLRSGWVTYRVVLEPSRLPPYQGRSAEQVALISGRLRTGARPEGLFAALSRDCRVYPFLYATNGERVILAALGRAPGSSPPPSVAPEPDRQPVMATLQAALEGIEVQQEAVSQLQAVVDHRYERLFPETTPR